MTSSFQSQQEKAFRMLGAPPDISQTNYLETEVDMVEAVNKQIDENQKDLEKHYDQLIGIWNHQFEKDQRAPQQVLDFLKTGKQTYFDLKAFNEFNSKLAKQREGIQAVRNAKWYSSGDLAKVLEAGYKDKEAYDLIERLRKLNIQHGEDAANVIQANGKTLLENEPGIAKLLRQGVGSGNEFHQNWLKDKDDLKNNFPLFLNLSASGFQVDVSHIHGKPPGTVLQVLDKAEPGEWDYIYNVILSNFLFNHSPIAFGTGEKVDRNLLEHFVQRKEVDHKAYIDIYSKALRDTGIENSGKVLKFQLRDNPKILSEWVNTYQSTFGGIGAAKNWQANYVANLGKSGAISRDELEIALNEPFTAFDNSEVTVSSYWKPQAAIMRRGVTEYERALLNDKTQAKEAEDFAIAEEIIANDVKNRKTPRSLSQKNDMIQEFARRRRITDLSKIPDIMKNLSYAGEETDDFHNSQLIGRELNGQSITEKDIAFFQDPLLMDKWRKKLTARGGSIPADGRNNFITQQVNEFMNRQQGTTLKTPEWGYVEEHLKGIYQSAFNAEYARSQNSALAKTAAEDAVLGRIQQHNDGKIDLTERIRNYADKESLSLINKTREAIIKNPSLISSDKPWEGETPHLQKAAEYFQGLQSGKRNVTIPEYYYNFKGIKKLPNGEIATPQNLMRYRLQATGILKDGKIKFPEDLLPKNTQKQLANNTPSSVYRACQENINEDWILTTTSDPLAKVNGEYDAIRHIDDDNETFRTDKLEKPLTQHTIGEVLDLMRQGYNNFGLYDISREGLIDVLENSNIQLDELFDKRNQDLLILGRLRQKAQSNQKYSTLTERYRRLVNIRQQDREQWLQLVGNLSPYDQLENLLPACATALVQETTTIR